jgi:thioester reductase-like protein
MPFSRSIFVTGYPGFIASRLVEKMARTDVQFFLLVQTEFVQKAIVEVEETVLRTGTPLENFALIEGDITGDDLGIGSDDLETLRETVTDVYHLAAVYDLAVEKELASRVNVEGTSNVNRFARSIRGLRRYNYVSTCYVAGKRKGRILENELNGDAGFRNFYEESKYLAEVSVDRLKGELPVTIFRPSVVIGDSKTGETAKYDGIYYLINYLRKAPSLLRLVNVGNENVRLNLVPVDFVVEAIAALGDDEKAQGATIALADPQPLKTAELFDSIAGSITGKSSAFTPPPSLIEWSLNLPFSPAITGMPHSAVPYFFISQSYDTSIAEGLLNPYDIRCPPFSEYVGAILDFVKTHPDL